MRLLIKLFPPLFPFFFMLKKVDFFPVINKYEKSKLGEKPECSAQQPRGTTPQPYLKTNLIICCCKELP